MDSAPTGLRERNRAEARARVVRSAFELFAAEGFDAVSVERICEAASVSRATFFNYFSQKDELLIEIGRQRLDRVQQFFAAQEAWNQKPTVEGLIELFVEFARGNEQLSPMGRHILLRALSNPGTAIRMKAMMETLRDRVAGYLGRMRPAAKSPGALAENAVAIYFWSTLEYVLEPEPLPGQLPETMRRRLEALFEPLRKRPARRPR